MIALEAEFEAATREHRKLAHRLHTNGVDRATLERLVALEAEMLSFSERRAERLSNRLRTVKGPARRVETRRLRLAQEVAWGCREMYAASRALLAEVVA